MIRGPLHLASPPEAVQDLLASDDGRGRWASVVLALKAAADFGINLPNHGSEWSWDQGNWDS